MRHHLGSDIVSGLRNFVVLAFLLLSAAPARAQSGCDIKALMHRPEVAQAVHEAYAATVHDEKEHGFVVLPNAVVVQQSTAYTSIGLQVPLTALATFHTHPMPGLNQPSQTDVDGVKGLQSSIPGICAYVIGSTRDIYAVRTIWEIFPDGRTKHVMFF